MKPKRNFHVGKVGRPRESFRPLTGRVVTAVVSPPSYSKITKENPHALETVQTQTRYLIPISLFKCPICWTLISSFGTSTQTNPGWLLSGLLFSVIEQRLKQNELVQVPKLLRSSHFSQQYRKYIDGV